MKNFNLQLVLQLLFLLILSLLPVYNIFAQSSTSDKQIRVKVFRSVDGKVQVIDTVMNAVDHAEALSSLKGFKADTAMLRRMNNSLSRVYRLDSTMLSARLKDIVNYSRGMKLDTATFRGLHGDRVKVYGLDRNLSPSDREKMYKRLKTAKLDTASFKILKSRTIYRAGQDSARQLIFERQIYSEDGDTIRFESIAPSKAFRIATDSASLININKDGNWIQNGKPIEGLRLEPIRIDKAMVFKDGHRMLHLDSLVATKVAVHALRISKNGKSGDGRVFIQGIDGKEHEITTEKLELSTGDRTVIIMLKADVKEVSAAEKVKLEASGNKVEASKKETLQIDDISFYPNPNTGRFNLSFNMEKGGDAAVRILDMNGKTVYLETVKGQMGRYEKQLDISSSGKGIYFLQIVQGDRYATKKVLVQ